MHVEGVLGQAPDYSDEQLLAIIERHGEGEDILDILDEPNMPGWGTFYRRCCSVHTAPDELRTAYAHAHEAWAERYVLQSRRIAETPELGKTETTKEWGTEVKTEDALGHRALKVKTRQWFAERMLERIRQQNPARGRPGQDGLPPMVPVVYIGVVQSPGQPLAVAVHQQLASPKGNGNGSG